MRWPGQIVAGSSLEETVTVMDVFPTLANAAGIEPGNTFALDGHNAWAPVDQLGMDVSPFGIVGMGGNVSEWTATLGADTRNFLEAGL